MKKLLKSYSFWTTLAGALGALAVTLSNVFGFAINSKEVENAIMGICGVLVAVGIVPKN